MAKEEQIKTSIDLTGEKEYRAACSSINTSLREINSEMKLATAEFANNASSSEALTRKQEVLQKQLAEQAKKAEAAEAALRKMREAGIDPTDPAYQKMQTNLNNTKAEMAKTEQQINSTSKELKQCCGQSRKSLRNGACGAGYGGGGCSFRPCGADRFRVELRRRHFDNIGEYAHCNGRSSKIFLCP